MLFGEGQDGEHRGDPLIAATRITHHRDGGTIHTGVTGRAGIGQHLRKGRIAEVATSHIAIDELAEAMAIAVSEGELAGTLILQCSLVDEVKLLQRTMQSILIDEVEVQGDRLLFVLTLGTLRAGRVGGTWHEAVFTIIGERCEPCMSSLDDGSR